MHLENLSVIYENPLPQLRSRQSAFPFLCECQDGTLAASHQIGEAFESVNGANHISFSKDGGITWSSPKNMFSKDAFAFPVTDSAKITALPGGKLIAVGYAYERPDPELPIGNPITGGLLDDFVFFSTSDDNGNSWNAMTPVPTAWGPHAEASAPITVLDDGTFITPITGFPDWEGNMTGPMCGRALRSEDQGKTWSDASVCMAFDEPVTCYEQRMCQLSSGIVINIAWNENTVTGKRMNNHYTYSKDRGITWSAPIDTTVRGQASSVCAIGGERLLALHAIRRDTDKPGIYGYIIDFSEETWKITDRALLWEPSYPIVQDKNMAEIFSFLKFGQPGALKLRDGSLMLSFWYAQDGQYRTMCARIVL